MPAQRDKLIELLNKNGWELVETQTLTEHWVLEYWLIKSIWTPADCCVFLSFEIDPMFLPRESSKAWCVKAHLNRPADCYIDYSPELPAGIESGGRAFFARVGRHLEKDLPAFFEELANLRTKFDNLKK